MQAKSVRESRVIKAAMVLTPDAKGFSATAGAPLWRQSVNNGLSDRE